VPGYNGGTDYSYVLEKNLQHFGWLSASEAPRKGFFGGMFGSHSSAPAAPQKKRPSLVIFNTDGENTDKARTMEVLEQSQQRGDQVYFLIIAYANGGGRFPFLQEIADRFDNTGVVTIPNLNRWLSQTDEEINDELLGEELIRWLKR
jgi:hypothetical protein